MSTALSIDTRPFNGLPAAWALERQSTAISSEAGLVREARLAVEDAIEHSQSLYGAKIEAISTLWSLADACGQANWDGEGARPAALNSVYMAEGFIRVLPEDIPLPEITPEPDGSIGLDWFVAPRRVFSVSFGTNHRLAYAWLDGTDRGHAVARFDGEAVPGRILDGIRRIAGGFCAP